MFRFFLWNRRCCILRWLTFALLIKWAFDARVKICAPDCTCVNVTNNPSSELPQHGKRVRCLNPLTITNVEVIASKPLPLDTLYLDLSGNPLSILENGSFLTFTKLEKLNLATAQINIINPGSFTGLDNLRHLNLSNNNLRTISAPTFEGLTRLEKLYISGNQLTKLVNGTFDTLPALKYLDLSRNFLICDCHLSWILEWSKTFDVQLSTKTSCMFPKQLKGSRVHKLKQAQWHCNWPLQVPIFNLNPSESQVVFAGDSLKFGCQISNIDSTSRLSWTFNDKELKNISEDEIVTDIQVSSDGMMWMGVLNIPHLQPSHDGSWGCWLYSVEGNKTQSVEIRVLSEDTAFCPLSVTTGNKGRYVWPRTVEGVTVELPCWTPSVNHQGRQPPMVTRVCNDRGFWERLDTSRCPYISEVTKVLEQFAKANLNITSSSVIESVRHLKNYTGDGRVLKDKMDVVFIARTINNYLKFIPKHKEVAESLIDIMAVVMQLDERLLLEAQLEDTSCSKLVEAVHHLPELVSEGVVSRHQNKLAVEEFIIKVDSFQGITCASFIRKNVGSSNSRGSNLPNASNKKIIRCKAGNFTVMPDDDADEILEASIRIPASLFHIISLQHSSSHRLQFTFYEDAALFPRTQIPKPRLGVLSSVVGSRLAKVAITNLSEPVFVTLRSPGIVGEMHPVWWDFLANGMLGDWSKEGCKLWNVYGNLVSFQCDRLADFGLLQDIERVSLIMKKKLGGAHFRLLHPIVYVGTVIGVQCLMAAIITYTLGYRLIHMPKKNKHSLINTWLAAVLLCLTFTLGVRHTENAKICQGVGLVLHYLTLVCLLWMIITASNTYKKLNLCEPRDTPQDEPLADYPLPPKPMLRFYLVGWGVPVIVCGISGAVNMEDYAGYDYCFLAFNHSIGAFYGPCAALVILLCIFYLLIHCAIRRVDEAELLSRRCIRDVTEIELVDTNNERASLGGTSQHSTKPASNGSGEEDDMEHPPASQLRGQVVVLLLFLLCWASAAISTANAFSHTFTFSELVFGCAYGTTIIALGLFIVIFHCGTREDVRLVWKFLSKCRESGLVRETEPLPPPTLAAGQANPQKHSKDSLDSLYSQRSDSTSHSVDGAKARMPKMSNAEAALVNPGGVTDTSWSGEMFYNHHQNGVARKFFRKHSRQQQRLKNCGDDERVVVVNSCHMQRGEGARVPALFPLSSAHDQCLGASEGKPYMVVCHDISTESQFNSSSQGLVATPSSRSGHGSEQSLLIVEEEEEEEDEDTNRLNPASQEAVGDAGHNWSKSETTNWKITLPPDKSAASGIHNANVPLLQNADVTKDGPPVPSKQKVVSSKEQGEATHQASVEDPVSASNLGNPIRSAKSDGKLAHKSGTLPRSNWDKQCHDSKKSKQPVYAYVNHSHHQKLSDILGSQCEKLDAGQRGVTRSASTGDTELKQLRNDGELLSKVHPSQDAKAWTVECKLKKETAV